MNLIIPACAAIIFFYSVKYSSVFQLFKANTWKSFLISFGYTSHQHLNNAIIESTISPSANRAEDCGPSLPASASCLCAIISGRC